MRWRRGDRSGLLILRFSAFATLLPDIDGTPSGTGWGRGFFLCRCRRGREWFWFWCLFGLKSVEGKVMNDCCRGLRESLDRQVPLVSSPGRIPLQHQTLISRT